MTPDKLRISGQLVLPRVGQLALERPMLSRSLDDPSGATRLRDRRALRVSYLSTRDRGAGPGLPASAWGARRSRSGPTW
jgi:hypothetical protein